MSEELTVRQRYRQVLQELACLDESSERQDTLAFQAQLSGVLGKLHVLESVVGSLGLFSGNDLLAEANTAYLPFLSVPFHQASVLLRSYATADGTFPETVDERVACKSRNLQRSIAKLAVFLNSLHALGGILSSAQEEVLQSYKNPYNPSLEDINRATIDPALRRARKIADFKEKEALRVKLSILDEAILAENDETDPLASLDEEVVRNVYIDQLKLHTLKAFGFLEAFAMELQVLANRPQTTSQERNAVDVRSHNKLRAFDYTSKVERDPTEAPAVLELINKLGRVLQPFVLTNKRAELRKQVFGTGQVLPSMFVEEYLDYELANGKMLQLEQPQVDSDDSDDSDEERRKREWDDWKDDNPKGSGNMKANIG